MALHLACTAIFYKETWDPLARSNVYSLKYIYHSLLLKTIAKHFILDQVQYRPAWFGYCNQASLISTVYEKAGTTAMAIIKSEDKVISAHSLCFKTNKEWRKKKVRVQELEWNCKVSYQNFESTSFECATFQTARGWLVLIAGYINRSTKAALTNIRAI